MNHGKQTDSTMHFKSAQISSVEISPNDMAQINKYALSPLAPEDVFAFKVSMAANEIDRDYEVFPRQALSKLANLFVGKTVVKDHEHKSDNQIARIYATDLIEGQPMRMTKAGEVFTELIAKCYMVKTQRNADLIAEIRAGIRKEVSLGCRIGKAICSICETDNVKTYCVHFPGKEYEGETCYFSLEQPQDAYELSFVAIPAQQHAGTVKSYGKKPCRQEEAEARQSRGGSSKKEYLANDSVQASADGQLEAETANEAENGANTHENDPEMLEMDAKSPEIEPTEPVVRVNETQHESSNGMEETASEFQDEAEAESLKGDCDQPISNQEEDQNRLTVNQDLDDSEAIEPSDEIEALVEKEQESDQEKEAVEVNSQQLAEDDLAIEKRRALNQLWEAAKQLLPAPTMEEQCHKIAELFLDFEKRLTINQKDENPEPHATPIQEISQGEEACAAEHEAEEALKAKQAEARIRALGLALSLRRKN